MSGPKVVRIVTREELIARCESRLARLDAAIAEWRRVGERNDTITDADIAATESRLADLQEILTQDRFAELQSGVDSEIAFLQADQETRLARAAEKMARARTSKRRTQSVANSLLASLDRSRVTVPAQLRQDLETIASNRSERSEAISQAFELLSQTGTNEVSDRQRRLAEALKESNDVRAVSAPFPQELLPPEDQALTRLEQRLATFAAVIGEAATAPFEDRLKHLSNGTQPQRRSLLLDSLELDLANAVMQARRRSNLQSQLRLIAAELDALSSEMGKAMAESVRARIEGPTESLAPLEVEARKTLAQAHDEIAARARRQAILTGLAGLGYEVSEGLETAWAQDGRVVLRRASLPEYGVEVGGGSGAARVQMRTVAFRDPAALADPAQDRDAEAIWCDNLTLLQSELAASGSEIVIEKALPVGATPLRIIVDNSRSSQNERRDSPKQRALD